MFTDVACANYRYIICLYYRPYNVVLKTITYLHSTIQCSLIYETFQHPFSFSFIMSPKRKMCVGYCQSEIYIQYPTVACFLDYNSMMRDINCSEPWSTRMKTSMCLLNWTNKTTQNSVTIYLILEFIQSLYITKHGVRGSFLAKVECLGRHFSLRSLQTRYDSNLQVLFLVTRS